MQAFESSHTQVFILKNTLNFCWTKDNQEGFFGNLF